MNTFIDSLSTTTMIVILPLESDNTSISPLKYLPRFEKEWDCNNPKSAWF